MKETLNTFSKGLNSDMYTENTPNQVMTDALNATLVTMNGNELVLLNDMGNTKLENAYLPEGYVPVGMKENGGIIYVASWNPVTKKGLIGSFPSPLRIYNDVHENSTKININLNKFTIKLGNLLIINNKFVKEPLFTTTSEDNINAELLIFHPGDRFILIGSLEAKPIYPKLRLASLSEAGNLITMDIKEEDLLLNVSNDEEISSILKGEDKKGRSPHIYNLDFPGKLVLIEDYNPIRSFNFTKTYKLEENTEEAIMTITPEIDLNKPIDLTNTGVLLNSNDLKLNTSFDIKCSKAEGYKDVTISPACAYGVDTSFEHTLRLDYNSLKLGIDKLTNFDYTVYNDFLEVTVGYDYFNMNSSNLLTNIVVDFYKNGGDILSAHKVLYVKNLSRELTFNIPYSVSGIDKGQVYVCIITANFSNSATKKFKYLVITIPYFNNVNIKNICDSKQKNTIYLQPNLNFINSITPSSIVFQINADKNNSINTKMISVDNIKSEDFYKEYPTHPEYIFAANKQYIYNINNILKNFTVDINNLATDEEGTVLLNEAFKNLFFTVNNLNLKIKDIHIDEEHTKRSYIYENGAGEALKNEMESNLGLEIKDYIDLKKWNIILNKPLYGRSNSITNKNIVGLKWLPASYNDKCIRYKFSDVNSSEIKATGGKKGLLKFDLNINITKGADWNPHKDNGTSLYENEGEEFSKEDAFNQTMAAHSINPYGSIGLFSGYGDLNGSLRIYTDRKHHDDHYRMDLTETLRGNGGFCWANKDLATIGEIDDADNYILASWKSEYDNWYLTNIGSSRDSYSSQKYNYKHVEEILNMILSQILLINKYLDIKKIALMNKYVYSNSFGTKINVTLNPESIKPIIKNSSESGDSILDIIDNICRNDSSIHNYFPDFKISSENTTKSFSLGEKNNLNDIISIVNAPLSFNAENVTSGDIYKIKFGKVKTILSNGMCELETDESGNYIFNTLGLYYHKQKETYNIPSSTSSEDDYIFTNIQPLLTEQVFKTLASSKGWSLEDFLKSENTNTLVIRLSYIDDNTTDTYWVLDGDSKGIPMVHLPIGKYITQYNSLTITPWMRVNHKY